MNKNAGKPVKKEDLINIEELLQAYYEQKPNAANEAQRVVFGTSGHRGSSLKNSFNETHILAIAQALCDYRKEHNITGTLFIAKDTHALSKLGECHRYELTQTQ